MNNNWAISERFLETTINWKVLEKDKDGSKNIRTNFNKFINLHLINLILRSHDYFKIYIKSLKNNSSKKNDHPTLLFGFNHIYIL